MYDKTGSAAIFVTNPAPALIFGPEFLAAAPDSTYKGAPVQAARRTVRVAKDGQSQGGYTQEQRFQVRNKGWGQI